MESFNLLRPFISRGPHARTASALLVLMRGEETLVPRRVKQETVWISDNVLKIAVSTKKNRIICTSKQDFPERYFWTGVELVGWIMSSDVSKVSFYTTMLWLVVDWLPNPIEKNTWKWTSKTVKISGGVEPPYWKWFTLFQSKLRWDVIEILMSFNLN